MTNKQYARWKKWMCFFGKLFRCHQLSDRSFHIYGFQLPLCARCTGIFLGLVLLGPLLCALLPLNMYLSLSFVVAIFIDGFTQLKGWRKSNNYLRLATGLGFGYALVSFIFHIVIMIIQLCS
ncbi:MAG: DUF2085 domain-containing protein [Clostridiales bacterium]|nr:DUF2085 domain-containing protein [Clostridiales bacterium]